jgi:hypothetical protein
VSQNPPDKPELPQLPDFPSGDEDPVPADPPPVDPDPQPFEPEPAPVEPAVPGGPVEETPPTPPTSPPPGVDDTDGGDGAGAGGSKLPVVLGGLAALLLIVGGIWWFTSRDSGKSPDEVVKDYLAATEDGDCDELITMVTEEMWSSGGELDRDEALEECENQVGSSPKMELKVGEVKTTSEKGKDATVEAEVTIQGDKTTLPVDLRKVDGEWLINEMR